MRLFKRKNDDKNDLTVRRSIRGNPDTSTVRPNNTFSYYANRSADETNVGRDAETVHERLPQQQPRAMSRLQRLVRRGVILIICLAVLAVVANDLIISPAPKIVALSTTTSQVFLGDTAMYQRAAAALFHHVANRNKLTIDTNEISAAMLRQFPELNAVSIALPVLGHQPTVYIQPSEPSMVLNLPNGSSFVLDTDGKALLAATSKSAQLAKLHVPIVTDQNDLQAALGQTLLPSTTVRFIQTVGEQLSAQNIHFSSFVLPRAASELDVYVAGKSYYGKFNTQDNSALQQAGTFIATYKHLQAGGISPRQYIDVRIDGRAYYR